MQTWCSLFWAGINDPHAINPNYYRLMCDGYIENKQDCHTEETQSLLAERIKAMLRLMEQKYVMYTKNDVC